MDANQLINSLGGTTVVAQLCQVTVGAVSQWRTGGIPKARLLYLRAVRPDAFPPTPHVDVSGTAPDREVA